jgi:hypothetical protein
MKATYDQLLNGEVDTASLINAPVTAGLEDPRESATARALRRWFKQNPGRERSERSEESAC